MKIPSLPPVTRALVLVFVTLSALTTLARYSQYSKLYDDALKKAIASGTPESPDLPKYAHVLLPYATLVPSLSLLYPWTLVTTSFIEQSLVGFMVTFGTLALGGRYLERVWGSRELAKFVALLAVVPTVLTTLVLIFLFSLASRETTLLRTVGGGVALQTGFLVPFKQLVPEHAIVFFNGALKIQVKYLVMPVLIAYTVLGLVLADPVQVCFTWAGFLTAWVYLRFFKVEFADALPVDEISGTTRHEIRGDTSDTFALAYFFYPEVVRAVVARVGDLVFGVLVALKVCTPFVDEDVEASNFRAARIRQPSATGSSDEADRRRALALKVLEERLDGK